MTPGFFCRQNCDRRAKLRYLTGKQINIAAGHQGEDAIFFGVASDNVKSADTNGACGPENRKTGQFYNYIPAKRLVERITARRF